MHKIGSIDRKKIDILVSDKTFTIGFVSVFARRSAVEYQSAVSELLQIQSIKDDEEREKKISGLSIEDLEHKIKLRDDVIENILISNGYDYDSDWWDKWTSYSDQNEFIQICLMKDMVQEKKKEKV